MHGDEHTKPLSISYVSKIPVVNQIMEAHKEIYNLFGSSIYHKTHYIFKSNLYDFHNKNICLFSDKDTSMAGYSIGIHREIQIWK